MISGAGAILGLAAGVFLTVGIFLLYPLVQGGQPIVPFPPTLIVLFEVTMLGMMWAAFFGMGGYLFGNAITMVAGPLSAAIFICVLAGIATLWWIFKYYEERLLAEAEASLGESK